MHENKNTVLEGAMRAGYGARGLVYLVIGALAVFAAVNGGEAEGSTGALNYLSKQQFGVLLVSAIAAGLFCYALWRFADAAFDLDREGSDARGVGARIGQFLSGASHAFLGVTATIIAIKGAQDEGNSAANWSATAMQAPMGRLIVMIAGGVTIGVGVYLFYKSWKATYRRDIRRTAWTARLAPLVRFGLVAHGFVLLIIGGAILYAGWSVTPSHAVGVGEALALVETRPFGRALLGVTGGGLAAFSVYCFVQTLYRLPPRLRDSDLKTLAP